MQIAAQPDVSEKSAVLSLSKNFPLVLRIAPERDLQETAPVFRETMRQRLRRWVLGCAFALMPSRLGLVPRLLLLSFAHLLAPEAERERLPEQPTYYSRRGLVGLSNDLSVEALLHNYRRGYSRWRISAQCSGGRRRSAPSSIRRIPMWGGICAASCGSIAFA